jgi:hypothetical protein
MVIAGVGIYALTDVKAKTVNETDVKPLSS